MREQKRYEYNPHLQILQNTSATNTALAEALRAGRELEAQDKQTTRPRSRSQQFKNHR